MSDTPSHPRTSSEYGQPRPVQSVLYSERLRVPVWWWVAALAVAALLAAEVHMGAPGLRAWLPYVILLPLAGGVMLWLGRLRVEVLGDAGNGGSSDGPLFRVGDARLPVSVIARVAEVPGTAKSAALGRQLDPAAFVQHRVWVKPMVLVVLDDPDDPTPYWLVSTRKPAEVVAALESARASR